MRSNKICFQCAGSHPHKVGKEACPAKGKQCRACNGYTHFAKCCKSKKKNIQENMALIKIKLFVP